MITYIAEHFTYYLRNNLAKALAIYHGIKAHFELNEEDKTKMKTGSHRVEVFGKWSVENLQYINFYDTVKTH